MEKVRLHTLLERSAKLTDKQKATLLSKNFRFSPALAFGRTWHRDVSETMEQREYKWAEMDAREVDYLQLERITIDLLYDNSGYPPVGLRFHFLTRNLSIVLDKATPIPESKSETPQEAEAWIVANLLELLLTPVNAPKVKEQTT